MTPAGRKNRSEYRVGTIGIAILVSGTSLLILASFMFGVLVGRNMESYPEKIARGIPSAIKEKMTVTDQPGRPETARADVPLTFYQTLSRRGDDSTISGLPQGPPGDDLKRHRETAAAEPAASMGRAAEAPTGAYTIQVAAFRDRASVERLQKRLTAMGYQPVIHESRLPERGTWYRLRIEGYGSREEAQKEARTIEGSIRGLSCLILKN